MSCSLPFCLIPYIHFAGPHFSSSYWLVLIQPIALDAHTLPYQMVLLRDIPHPSTKEAPFHPRVTFRATVNLILVSFRVHRLNDITILFDSVWKLHISGIQRKRKGVRLIQLLLQRVRTVTMGWMVSEPPIVKTPLTTSRLDFNHPCC